MAILLSVCLMYCSHSKPSVKPLRNEGTSFVTFTAVQCTLSRPYQVLPTDQKEAYPYHIYATFESRGTVGRYRHTYARRSERTRSLFTLSSFLTVQVKSVKKNKKKKHSRASPLPPTAEKQIKYSNKQSSTTTSSRTVCVPTNPKYLTPR